MSELHNNDVGWSASPEALGRHGRGCCNAGFLLPDAAWRTAPDSFILARDALNWFGAACKCIDAREARAGQAGSPSGTSGRTLPRSNIISFYFNELPAGKKFTWAGDFPAFAE